MTIHGMHKYKGLPSRDQIRRFLYPSGFASGAVFTASGALPSISCTTGLAVIGGASDGNLRILSEQAKKRVINKTYKLLYCMGLKQYIRSDELSSG